MAIQLFNLSKLRQRIGTTLFITLCLIAPISLQAQEPDEIIAAVTEAVEPTIIQSMESPDGAYTAEVIVYPCVDIGDQSASYERLDIKDNRTGEMQQITEQVINCGGLGAYGLWIRHWSANSAYIYFTDSREGTPDGMVTDWYPPITRVQVADISLQPLGQARFSPDGAQIVAWDQTRITVLSVNTNDVIEFVMMPANLMVTSVLWMPDSSGVLYVQTDNVFDSSRSTVTFIDIAAQDQTILMDNES